jgi:hypothetical protein
MAPRGTLYGKFCGVDFKLSIKILLETFLNRNLKTFVGKFWEKVWKEWETKWLLG